MKRKCYMVYDLEGKPEPFTSYMLPCKQREPCGNPGP